MCIPVLCVIADFLLDRSKTKLRHARLHPPSAGLDCWIGKEIDSPRRVSTGCTPQFSGPALLRPEGSLIARAFTLLSQGAAALDYRSQDQTSLNNRSICA